MPAGEWRYVVGIYKEQMLDPDTDRLVVKTIEIPFGPYQHEDRAERFKNEAIEFIKNNFQYTYEAILDHWTFEVRRLRADEELLETIETITHDQSLRPVER